MNEPLVIVTGAGGQLGIEFKNLSNQFPSFQFLFAHKLDLDVTVESWVNEFIDLHKPAVVINCAAYTNVEKAEDEPETAQLGNSLAAGYLAEACARNGALLVHISTDYVFDGKKTTPYTEDDDVHPLNIYGQSKLDGERLVHEKSERHYIIRTSWLYSAHGHNFFRTMLRLAKERGELKVVSDQIASPTYAGSLANDIMRLLQKVIIAQQEVSFGLYHYTENGTASWFDFASEIMKQFKMGVPVHPQSSGAFPVKAVRPMYSKMSTSKWTNNTKLELKTWQEGLTKCKEIYTIQENNI